MVEVVQLSHKWGPGIVIGILAGSVALAIWWRWGKRVFAVERLIVLHHPIALSGAPDLVLQRWGGELVVHDLKNREQDKVFESDAVQLSLYRFLLEKSTGRRVSDVGWIRVRRKGRAEDVELPVQLWGDDRVIDLWQRYQRMRAGAETKTTQHAGLCQRCSFFKKQCPGTPRAKSQQKR